MKLALAFFDITDLKGGGGAERFFFDFFSDYTQYKGAKHEMLMITDGIQNIESSGRSVRRDHIVSIQNFRYYNFRLLQFLNKRNSFFLGNLLNAVKVFRVLRRHRIDKLIIPFYHPREYYFYRFLGLLGVRLDYFIVDCRIPEHYESNSAPYRFKDNYERFFENCRFANIHTWYDSVKNFIGDKGIIKRYRGIYSYHSRYSRHATAFAPQDKKNQIVYAARMDEQKDPLFFLQALKLLKDRGELPDWEVKMFGDGPMLNKVSQFIDQHHLPVTHAISGNLEPVFSESKIFVSTQKLENFPSLAISEAMSKGNIIVAKNVGQTHLLVKDSVNGFLCEEDKPETLALCLQKAMRLDDAAFNSMAAKSVDLMRTEHTFERFSAQFDQFVAAT